MGDRGNNTGARIRARRLDLGLRQADVAQTVGISPSYLNLIEHDRRRIAGKLLSDIAQALSADPAKLAHGAATALLDQLSTAATMRGAVVEADRTTEMAARYPGWAELIAAQGRRIASLEGQVRALNDRLTHDPALATALHEVISSVTSIRSTASILTGDEKLDADWLRRFHGNIHSDAFKLAQHSEALIRYLETPAETDTALSPVEEVSAWLAKTNFHLVDLENGGDAEAFAHATTLGVAARSLLADHAIRYRSDAAALPLKTFAPAARRAGYDPAILAGQFGVGLDIVLRRLAGLPPYEDHPPIGLAVCDAAGGLQIIKAVPGFVMPRGGSACPLWPLFTALGQHGRPIRAEVALPGTPQTRLLCFALATQTTAGFDAPPVVNALMLVLPDPPEGNGPVHPIGSSCRICPRDNCAARREPVSIPAHL